MLVGDAYGFLDPVYSSGVFLALKSGEMAADAIHEAIEKRDFSARQLGSWGDEFIPGMEAIRKLVYAFYTKDFSFSRFLEAHPECLNGIVDILSGKIYVNDVTPIFGPMGQMCNLPDDVAQLFEYGCVSRGVAWANGGGTVRHCLRRPLRVAVVQELDGQGVDVNGRPGLEFCVRNQGGSSDAYCLHSRRRRGDVLRELH